VRVAAPARDHPHMGEREPCHCLIPRGANGTIGPASRVPGLLDPVGDDLERILRLEFGPAAIPVLTGHELCHLKEVGQRPAVSL
jgi:hypothetical protein